jgi:drebrin-like protein
MASLNTSSNGPNITKSYQKVVNAPPPSGPQANSSTYAQWAVFTVAAPLVSAFQQDGGKESVLKVQSSGGV